VTTHPERFRPLHDVADALIAHLTASYDVEVAGETPPLPRCGNALEQALQALPRRSARRLRHLLDPLDALFAARTLPDPLADPGSPWWRRRLTELHQGRPLTPDERRRAYRPAGLPPPGWAHIGPMRRTAAGAGENAAATPPIDPGAESQMLGAWMTPSWIMRSNMSVVVQRSTTRPR
jgi:hypothetical protein